MSQLQYAFTMLGIEWAHIKAEDFDQDHDDDEPVRELSQELAEAAESLSGRAKGVPSQPLHNRSLRHVAWFVRRIHSLLRELEHLEKRYFQEAQREAAIDRAERRAHRKMVRESNRLAADGSPEAVTLDGNDSEDEEDERNMAADLEVDFGFPPDGGEPLTAFEHLDEDDPLDESEASDEDGEGKGDGAERADYSDDDDELRAAEEAAVAAWEAEREESMDAVSSFVVPGLLDCVDKAAQLRRQTRERNARLEGRASLSFYRASLKERRRKEEEEGKKEEEEELYDEYGGQEWGEAGPGEWDYGDGVGGGLG